MGTVFIIIIYLISVSHHCGPVPGCDVTITTRDSLHVCWPIETHKSTWPKKTKKKNKQQINKSTTWMVDHASCSQIFLFL